MKLKIFFLVVQTELILSTIKLFERNLIMLLFLKIAATLIGCFFLWYKLKDVFDFKYHDIEFETIANNKPSLLISYIEKNIFGKFKTTKYFILDESKFFHNFFNYETGEKINYDASYTNKFTEITYFTNRKFINFIYNKINAKKNLKLFHETVETHYSKIVKDLDKELNLKFENLEKEKAQAAKIKARIQDLPKEEKEEFVTLFQENAENISGKKKSNSK